MRTTWNTIFIVDVFVSNSTMVDLLWASIAGIGGFIKSVNGMALDI